MPYPQGALQTQQEFESVLLQPGNIVWEVLGLGEQSYMQEYMVGPRSKVVFNRAGTSYFCYHMLENGREASDFSLRDCNIGGLNNYNNHFLFTVRAHAEAYLEVAKTIPFARDPLDFLFEYDEPHAFRYDDDDDDQARRDDDAVERMFFEDMREERESRSNMVVFTDGDPEPNNILGAKLIEAIRKSAVA
jgi:hypothetical protein